MLFERIMYNPKIWELKKRILWDQSFIQIFDYVFSVQQSTQEVKWKQFIWF